MDTELDDLPTLTPKQTAFVNALLKGKTAVDAYREAYNCERMGQGAIAVEASRLRRSPKIALWLRAFQRLAFDKVQVTAENHLTELVRARELAIANGQIAAGVQAEHYRGKAAGLYQDRVRLTIEPSDAELIKAVAELFGEETAEAIGAALEGFSRENC